MSERRALLLVVPTVPAPTGNGLAMRAALTLQLLAARDDVFLLIIPLHGPTGAALAPTLARACRAVAIWPGLDAAAARGAFHAALRMPWPPDEAAPPAGLDALLRAAPWLHERFAIVHLQRLTTIPFARPWLFARDAEARPRRHFDLDEVESVSRRRLAALYRETGQDAAARFATLEAARCEALERRILDRFDRVYVCSGAEARHLPPARRADVRILPNALPIVDRDATPFENRDATPCDERDAAPCDERAAAPFDDRDATPPGVPPPCPLPARSCSFTGEGEGGRGGVGEGALFTFLFVGTLAYTPNADAVTYFCREVLPHLRRLAPGVPGEFAALEVIVVGAAPDALANALAGLREVRVVGAVPDVAPWYARADAVIVPLRAGGGTRIKVLEAMRYRRPVVSTSAGIDGYALRDGDDVLVGDTAEGFAAQCARLMRDRALGPRLGAAAYARYLADHTPAAAARALGE